MFSLPLFYPPATPERAGREKVAQKSPLNKNIVKFCTALGRKAKLAPQNQKAGLKQLPFVSPHFA
jgi:hypothetical protein